MKKIEIKKINTFLWLGNFLIFLIYITGGISGRWLFGAITEYSWIQADSFDGTVYPIEFVPNWLQEWMTDKTLRYEEIASSNFKKISKYSAKDLSNTEDSSASAIQDKYTYITAYMGRYMDETRKEYSGSHLAVDIRAPLGTPVKAISNGVIVKIRKDSDGVGKYIILRISPIEYKDSSQDLYVAYLHLEDVWVDAGQVVKKWEIIGKVGMTGFTTTPHLHFQIDTEDAPYHSYWPYTFTEAKNAWLDFYEATNKWLGMEKAMKYTINPMDFINEFESYNPETEVVIEEEEEEEEDIVVVEEEEEELVVKKEEDVEEKTLVASVGNIWFTPAPIDRISMNVTKKNKNIITLEFITLDSYNEVTQYPIFGELQFGWKTEEKEQEVARLTSQNFKDGKYSISFMVDPDVLECVLYISGEWYSSQKIIYLEGIEKISSAPIVTENTKKNLVASSEEDTSETKKFYTISATTEQEVVKNSEKKLFPDISGEEEYYDALVELYEKGVIKGYDNGEFRPNNYVSRAEILAIVFRALNIDIDYSMRDHDFKDIPDNHWIEPFVYYALSSGIITPSRKYFYPNTPVSKSEIIKILLETGKKDLDSYNNSFSDISGDEWYADYAETAKNLKIIEDSWKFSPTVYMKRSDVVEMIFKYLKDI